MKGQTEHQMWCDAIHSVTLLLLFFILMLLVVVFTHIFFYMWYPHMWSQQKEVDSMRREEKKTKREMRWNAVMIIIRDVMDFCPWMNEKFFLWRCCSVFVALVVTDIHRERNQDQEEKRMDKRRGGRIFFFVDGCRFFHLLQWCLVMMLIRRVTRDYH